MLYTLHYTYLYTIYDTPYILYTYILPTLYSIHYTVYTIHTIRCIYYIIYIRYGSIIGACPPPSHDRIRQILIFPFYILSFHSSNTQHSILNTQSSITQSPVSSPRYTSSPSPDKDQEQEEPAPTSHHTSQYPLMSSSSSSSFFITPCGWFV